MGFYQNFLRATFFRRCFEILSQLTEITHVEVLKSILCVNAFSLAVLLKITSKVNSQQFFRPETGTHGIQTNIDDENKGRRSKINSEMSEQMQQFQNALGVR